MAQLNEPEAATRGNGGSAPPAGLADEPHRLALPTPIEAPPADGALAADAPAAAAHPVDALRFGRAASALVPARPAEPLYDTPEGTAASQSGVVPAPDVRGPDLATIVASSADHRPRRVDHRAFQTDFTVSQGSRGTCWAFAGTAALEAAYARQGIHVKLSEHYCFHVSKAHENQRGGPGIHSLIGFQGSSDIVHHLTYWRLPLYGNAPYIDQPALQALADAIPQTGGGLANSGAGTLDQDDWFEFDLRNIPLDARWQAQYGVASFAKLTNYSDDDVKNVLVAGYDVVIDVPGHCMLIYGYDDDAGVFLIKNSQSLPGFETMKYSGDSRFTLSRGQAYYITSVRPPQTEWAAMWLGRWETDHDGWRGRMVIRRYLDIRADRGVATPAAPISLGSWYGFDGRILSVDGGFTDGGRGLRCTIGGQPFELYLHARDPYRAAGRCNYANSWFGALFSRGTAVAAGSGFDRSETIGLWDSVHDGWRGEVRIGVDPHYREAATGAQHPARVDPAPLPRQVDLHVNFGADNPDQHFQLLHQTREDGLMGGITQWGGSDFAAETRMSANLYVIAANGDLKWYRHLGRYTRTFDWDPPSKVGNGWAGFKAVFGGGDGVIYAIKPNGDLMWYYHDGRNQGQFQWLEPKQIGNGWNFSRVFAGDGGVIYGVLPNGDLKWYRHLGRTDGSYSWEAGGVTVGTGWGGFVALAAGPDGTIYGTLPDGRLMWYRHYGHDHGFPIWHGGVEVGSGWQGVDQIWVAGNGFVYGRNRANELWLWRHHGFQTGTADWTPGARVGTGWGGADVWGVLLT